MLSQECAPPGQLRRVNSTHQEKIPVAFQQSQLCRTKSEIKQECSSLNTAAQSYSGITDACKEHKISREFVKCNSPPLPGCLSESSSEGNKNPGAIKACGINCVFILGSQLALDPRRDWDETKPQILTSLNFGAGWVRAG